MGRGKIFVVDDDASVRQSTCWSLRAAGYDAVGYESGEAFLEHADLASPGCAMLDLNMPGLSGIDVLQRLRERGSPIRGILLTGYGDIPTAVRAMRAGAVDLIEKPYDPEALLEAVARALGESDSPYTSEVAEEQRAEVARARIRDLSPRQCQVLKGLVAGLPNKIIAQDLGVSPRTIEMHRADMMSRLGVGNLSEALRVAYDAGLAPERRGADLGRPGAAGGRRAGDSPYA